jgi:hypothetical protein
MSTGEEPTAQPPRRVVKSRAGRPADGPDEDRSADDGDVGWGEIPAESGRDDDWYRRERPPHHG